MEGPPRHRPGGSSVALGTSPAAVPPALCPSNTRPQARQRGRWPTFMVGFGKFLNFLMNTPLLGETVRPSRVDAR